MGAAARAVARVAEKTVEETGAGVKEAAMAGWLQRAGAPRPRSRPWQLGVLGRSRAWFDRRAVVEARTAAQKPETAAGWLVPPVTRATRVPGASQSAHNRTYGSAHLALHCFADCVEQDNVFSPRLTPAYARVQQRPPSLLPPPIGLRRRPCTSSF